MGAESVKLAWQPAIVSPVIKKPPPVTYRLEAQELPASDWLPLSSRLSDTSYYYGFDLGSSGGPYVVKNKKNVV
jgi:hypothetical protein